MSDHILTVDDMDHAGDGYPEPPAGSSAFFWGSPASVNIGNWFVTTPSAVTRDASMDDIVPARAESTKAYRVTGADFDQGVDLWAQLDHPSGRTVDLSAFSGVSFWARIEGEPRELIVALGDGRGFFGRPATVSPPPSVGVTVSDGWQQFVLGFEDFDADATAIASFDFVVPGGSPIDFWVDDLALVCRGSCP